MKRPSLTFRVLVVSQVLSSFFKPFTVATVSSYGGALLVEYSTKGKAWLSTSVILLEIRRLAVGKKNQFELLGFAYEQLKSKVDL